MNLNKLLGLTLSFFMLCASTTILKAQDCDGDRYKTNDFFPTLNERSDILFGENMSVPGFSGVSQPQSLYLDFFEGEGDTATKRPLIIFAFGGSFIGGQRSQVHYLCEAYAKMGYATATIDYRVGVFNPNKVNTTLAVLRGMHDMKAAVRFFRQDAATVDTFNIDPDRIIIGGVSAGAISAIQAAYLDKESEIPAYLYGDTAGLGGVEGNSGNPGYSSKPAGVINFSGAIGDTLWIEQDDVPIVGFHETGDGTVPYDTREVAVSGVPTGLIASGSGHLHRWAETQGVVSDLTSYNTNGHVGYLGSERPQVLEKVRNFMYNEVSCKNSPGIGVGIAVNDKKQNNFEVYPNPSNGRINVRTSNQIDDGILEVYNSIGQLLLSERINGDYKEMDLAGLNKGLYVVRISSKDNAQIKMTKKLILN
ncbi:MAG: T9SS type A sorting domain-containing protein [Chitinophagales bacterium]